ncbi:transcription termination factor NusA, partial [Porphyromonas sp.]
MARKKESTSLKVLLTEFKELKNIDEETMLHVLEDSFRSILAKMFGSDDNFDVIINADSGDFEIWRTREVVADDAVERENEQVAYTEALEIDPEAEIGDDVTDSVDFLSFGRRAIVNLRQTLSSKILDLQKEHFYQTFIERVGELITAEVYQVWKRETLLVDEDGNELIMPKSEQIPDEYFRKGDSVHAVIARVDNENNNPRVTLSRTSPEFLKRLFEINVPEIADGLITIKRVARIPGVRAKIAVESYDDRIDPVGSCVGMNGSRIRGIVRELHGENIDVLTYTANDSLFIQRALSPAKISSIELYPETAKAEVY